MFISSKEATSCYIKVQVTPVHVNPHESEFRELVMEKQLIQEGFISAKHQSYGDLFEKDPHRLTYLNA